MRADRIAHPERLTVIDEIFLRTHSGYGTPIALQGLWRTEDRVDRALLEAVHAALRTGPLGRRVVRPTVPGARPRWQWTVRAYPLDYPDRVVPVGELLDWADGTGAGLDPERGPGWRLAAVALDDGGSVVSLTCSHALADGRGLVIAADEALRIVTGVAGPSARGRAVAPVVRTDAFMSDWADALRQWSIVIGGTVRALRQGIPPRPGAVPPRPAGPATARPTCGVVLQCPVRDWDDAAMARGGTANSLFIWLVARILWAAGFPGSVIEASLPVDTRDEPRVDNDLAVTSVSVTESDTPATLREKARTAYEYRMSAPGGIPEELLQVIPDRWAAALAAGAGERDMLCSNIGTLPAALEALGPHRCTGVAARAIHPGLANPPRTRLSGYLCRSGSDYVLSLVGIDPALIESASALRASAEKIIAPLSLPVRFW